MGAVEDLLPKRQQLSTVLFITHLHVLVKSKPMAHEELLQEEASGKRKDRFQAPSQPKS